MEGKGVAPGKTLSFVKFDSEDEYSSDDDHEDSSDDDYEDSSDEEFEEAIASLQKRVELYRNQNIEYDEVIASKEEEVARLKEELAKIKEEHARIKDEHAKIKELLLKRAKARVAGESAGTEPVEKQKHMLRPVSLQH